MNDIENLFSEIEEICKKPEYDHLTFAFLLNVDDSRSLTYVNGTPTRSINILFNKIGNILVPLAPSSEAVSNVLENIKLSIKENSLMTSFTKSSGNVFKDLGYEDAEKMHEKSQLIMQIEDLLVKNLSRLSLEQVKDMHLLVSQQIENVHLSNHPEKLKKI